MKIYKNEKKDLLFVDYAIFFLDSLVDRSPATDEENHNLCSYLCVLDFPLLSEIEKLNFIAIHELDWTFSIHLNFGGLRYEHVRMGTEPSFTYTLPPSPEIAKAHYSWKYFWK